MKLENSKLWPNEIARPTPRRGSIHVLARSCRVMGGTFAALCLGVVLLMARDRSDQYEPWGIQVELLIIFLLYMVACFVVARRASLGKGLLGPLCLLLANGLIAGGEILSVIVLWVERMFPSWPVLLLLVAYGVHLIAFGIAWKAIYTIWKMQKAV